MTVVDAPVVAPTPPPRRRRRLVLWVAVCAAAVLAALVTVFATATPSSQLPDDSSPLLGKPAPEVVGPDQTGATVSLAGYRGRWVLVNFAASWCTDCVSETPQLLEFADANTGADSATILTVEEDPPDLGSLRRFLASRHATWPVVNDPDAQSAYGLPGIPDSFLVDPVGTVVYVANGPVVADKLDSLIAAYPASGLPGSASATSAGATSGSGAGSGGATSGSGSGSGGATSASLGPAGAGAGS